MAVQWESTDQFGNMFIGVSQAESQPELVDDFKALVEELAGRGAEGVVTVDFEYGEINGPDPEAVSHVLQAPWLEGCNRDDTFAALEDAFGSISSNLTLQRA